MIRFCLVSLFLLSFGLSVIALDQIIARVHGATVILKWKTLIPDQAVLFSVSIRNGENLDWLAIGFSDHGAYNNSDICLFRNGVLRDYYVDSSFHMELDRGQDCELTRKTKDGFEFRRRFNTCDNKDYAIEPGTTQFIVAGCYEFTNKFDAPMVDKALHYGKLIDSNEQVVQMENDRTQFTVLADKAEIPAEITTYWCVVKEIPVQVQNVKHHIIKMNAVVEPGNEHIVHHMEIFQCQTDDQTEFSGDCNSPNKPRQSKSCSHVMAAWAMGEGAVFYPSETGLPLGGANSKRFVMVEIHYNNVMKMAGLIDNSGFEFTATPSLRRYDAAIMELGLIYSDANSIPPGQKSFPITGHCVADCTEKLPPSGIFVFGSQLHAHLTGRKLFTSHYRNGVKIGEINRDNHYSPHWQHLQDVRPYVHVKPGDVLSTTCVYETMNRDRVTLGGYGIEDEMCVNYIYYYPASSIEVCKSAVDNSTLHNYFKQRHNIHQSHLPIHKKYSVIDWSNNDNVLSLSELFSVGPLNMHCLQHNGKLFPNHKSNWTKVAQPVRYAGPYIKARDEYECPALND